MTSDLSKVYNRLLRTVEANFTRPIKFEGIVADVDTDQHTFMVKTMDGSKMIECNTIEKLSPVLKGNKISVKGRMKIDAANASKVYMAVEYFYLMTEQERYSLAINTYDRLVNTLRGERCQAIINKMMPRSPPSVINNVGLVVMPNNEDNLENFRREYEKKCYGRIYVCHLSEGNVDVSLKYVIAYFSKYHNIDMICLLTNQLSLMNVCELSSKTNVKYLLNRKNTPYIVSVLTDNVKSSNDKVLEPLSAMLSNKKVNGIEDFVGLVHEIQASVKNRLEHGIQSGTNLLRRVLEHQRTKLFEYKMGLAELSDPRFLKSQENPFEQLRSLLLKCLAREKTMVYNTHVSLMKNIITDPHFERYYPVIVEAERRAKRQPKDDTGPTISKVVLQPDPSAVPAKQTEPTDKQQSESKKIENKSSDNSSADILNINIHHRKNGNF